MRKCLLACLLSVIMCSLFLTVNAQDKNYARNIIKILSAEEMHGRGYVFRGDSIAADFIKTEMILNGLKPFSGNFYQNFTISVNTLPGNLELNINNKEKKPGYDFLVLTPSKGLKGRFKAVTINHNTSFRKLDRIKKKGLQGKVLIVDNLGGSDAHKAIYNDLKYYNIFGAEAVINLTERKPPLMWSVYSGHLLLDFPSLQLSKHSTAKRVRRVELDIENEFYQTYHTQNVIAYVEGTKYPDSFFVFTAHYDHLGRMGRDTYFPGAHDNASGVALMLDLAGYYNENPPEYSVAFMAVAAEEAGLLGSKYYTENPFFPLSNIKLLINLDMISTGEEGMMVVNGQVFVDDYLKLNALNEQYGLLKEIRSRGEAANSDHYFFYAKGVKSFYFYTLGGQSHYHNIYDKPETLSLYAYNELFKLITLFIDAY